jgi:hypothetical protein
LPPWVRSQCREILAVQSELPHALRTERERALEILEGGVKHAGSGDLPFTIGLMSSIWCNEPWVGLDTTGPWGTEFDS